MQCKIVANMLGPTGASTVAVYGGVGGRGGAWQEWPVDVVVCLLRSGAISKGEVAQHAQAGANSRGASLTGVLAKDADTIATSVAVEDVIAAYKVAPPLSCFAAAKLRRHELLTPRCRTVPTLLPPRRSFHETRPALHEWRCLHVTTLSCPSELPLKPVTRPPTVQLCLPS